MDVLKSGTGSGENKPAMEKKTESGPGFVENAKNAVGDGMNKAGEFAVQAKEHVISKPAVEKKPDSGSGIIENAKVGAVNAKNAIGDGVNKAGGAASDFVVQAKEHVSNPAPEEKKPGFVENTKNAVGDFVVQAKEHVNKPSDHKAVEPPQPSDQKDGEKKGVVQMVKDFVSNK